MTIPHLKSAMSKEEAHVVFVFLRLNFVLFLWYDKKIHIFLKAKTVAHRVATEFKKKRDLERES